MLVNANFGYCLRLIGSNTAINEAAGESPAADLNAAITADTAEYMNLYITEAPLIPEEEGDVETSIDNTLIEYSRMRLTFPVKLCPLKAISEKTAYDTLLWLLSFKCLYIYAPKTAVSSMKAYPVKLEHGTDHGIRVVCPNKEITLSEVEGSEKVYEITLTFKRKYL
jgi:hypothetical protein